MKYINKKEYTKYLQSTEWKEKRKKIYEERKGICELCGIKLDKIYNVHHLNYKHLHNEPNDDLLLLCEDCHKKIHSRERRNKGYVKLNKELLMSERWLSLNYTSQIMYIYMKLWAGDSKQFCYAYRLALNIFKSHTTIKKAIDELTAKDFLLVKRGEKGTKNIYIFKD